MLKKMLVVVMLFVLCISTLAGCGANNSNEDGVTEVSWYLMGIKADSSFDTVWEEVNKLMVERYGIKINFVMTDAGSLGQKIQMMNASQEAYDLVLTTHSINPFSTNVANGSLLDLTDLLPKYAPKLYESLSDAEIASVSVDGRMYAVPNWQMQSYATGLWFPEEYLTQSGFSLDDFNKLEDLEPYLKKMTEINPKLDKNDINWNNSMTYYGMTPIIQDKNPAVVYYNKEGKPKVINQYESPEFMEYAKLVHSWVEKGYMTKVHDQAIDTYYNAEVKRGAVGVCRYMPATARNNARVYKYPFVTKQLSDAVITNQGIQAAMTGIGTFSKNPEAAVKVLEIMYTDKEILNMVLHGIEGVNYDKVGENLIHKKDDNTYGISYWQISSAINSYLSDDFDPQQWEQEKAIDAEAKASPIIGFSPDTDSILGALGNCDTVIKEKYDSINRGLVDPEKAIPELNKALKQAGVDKVIAELQRQIDEWWEANKK